MGVWAALLAATGSFDQLTNMAVMSYALFWIPVVLGVLVLRRRMPDAPRPYRLPGGPLAPLLFVLVMIWIVASALITTPRESITTIVLILLGLPLYPLFRGSSARVAAALTGSPAPRA
jgi:APA family basic amino acid/polyamine antiporter